MEYKNSLPEYQAQNRARTVAKIQQAMHTIETEIASEGIYPQNRGRVSRNEVCRRAGISSSTLKNPTHASTAKAIDGWMIRLRSSPSEVRSEARTEPSRVSDLLAMIESIAANYDKFKVEYGVLEGVNRDLQAENDSLRTRVVSLERALDRQSGPSNVLSFDRC